ncbi:MAG: ATP-binding protein [Deltaproteobacteria bacterium]|nr:ATP-binding protein [Deltaproteobacteria bacterium]
MSRLMFSRYRCFQEAQALRLGKLNLLYGTNGAGKSAVLRLPALLAGSMRGAPSLNLAHPAVAGGGFNGLIWHGDGGGDPLMLGLELVPGGSFRWELTWSEAFNQPVITAMEGPWRGPSQRLEWRSDRGQRDLKAQYFEDTPGRSGREILRFHGLIARRDHAASEPESPLTAFEAKVSWLTAKRVGPSRAGVSEGAFPPSDPTGAAWSEALLAPATVAFSSVSKWYEDHCQRALTQRTLDQARRLSLRKMSQAAPDIPFPDEGLGLQQVFPVLVGLERLREEGGLLCIEEPEAHLHPQLQRALADRIAEVLVENDQAQVLLETHSEVFLNAALLHAITDLRGAVRLHWVAQGDGGCRVREVQLDDEGRPQDDTLRAAYEVVNGQRREILSARRENAR